MVSNGALRWAQEAVWWAKLPYPAKPDATNYDWLLEAVCKEAYRSGKTHLRPMRCQIPVGNNNYWPCLSRLMLLDQPDLLRWIKPRVIDDLDCQAGIAMMLIYFGDVTKRRAKVRSWKHIEAVGD